MSIIDLNTYSSLCQLSGKTLEGTVLMYTGRLIFSQVIDFMPLLIFSPLCGEIPGRFQNKKILMSRSIPLYGLCPAHLPGQSSRYRCMSSFSKQKTLQYGCSWQSVQINASRSQRETGGGYMQNWLKLLLPQPESSTAQKPLSTN